MTDENPHEGQLPRSRNDIELSRRVWTDDIISATGMQYAADLWCRMETDYGTAVLVHTALVLGDCMKNTSLKDSYAAFAYWFGLPPGPNR